MSGESRLTHAYTNVRTHQRRCAAKRTRAACINQYEPATYVWRRIACVRNMLNSARVSLGLVRLLDDALANSYDRTQQRAELTRFLTSAIMAQIAAAWTLFEK